MIHNQEHPDIARVLATGEVTCRKRRSLVDEDAVYEERREQTLTDPCPKCRLRKRCDRGCDRWRGYYLQQQDRIVAYGKALAGGWRPTEKERREEKEVFAYSHPEAVRRFLRKHPCEGCLLEKGCKEPCSRYLHWYDCRMDFARNLMQ